jgi:hypothetical protein
MSRGRFPDGRSQPAVEGRPSAAATYHWLIESEMTRRLKPARYEPARYEPARYEPARYELRGKGLRYFRTGGAGRPARYGQRLLR